jgi:hypothetical protein
MERGGGQEVGSLSCRSCQPSRKGELQTARRRPGRWKSPVRLSNFCWLLTRVGYSVPSSIFASDAIEEA